MNVRSLPVLPSLIVAAAVAIMIALGFWQLGRADEKEALLASYRNVSPDAAPVEYPLTDEGIEQNLYRATMVQCAEVVSKRDIVGTNSVGVKGWAHLATCKLTGSGESADEAEVALGWSRTPQGPEWSGGEVTGILAPGGKIVADPPLAGLGPLAKPDPADLPNNHLSYAVQWFLFALTALIIFILAVRKKAGRYRVQRPAMAG